MIYSSPEEKAKVAPRARPPPTIPPKPKPTAPATDTKSMVTPVKPGKHLGNVT